MPAETDSFIVATFALWAGDFVYFERLLKEFSPPWSTASLDDTIESPEDVMRATGALRLRQLWQKKGEFKRLADEYLKQGLEIVEQPLILETEHLRGTVWRISEREFTLQAYLKDLTWEEEIFARALREAARNKPPERRPSRKVAETRGPLADMHSTAEAGTAWAVVGNPFLQVELTDLALVEVSALWIEAVLPENAEVITTPLLTVLKALDESGGH